MSDCGCPTTADPELNKKLLKVFLEDDDVYSGEPLSNLPNFTVFRESHMKEAYDKANELSGLGVSEMIDVLSDLKNRHPSSTYGDYLSRIALFQHPETNNMTLPPPHQTIPRAFFSKDQLLTGPGENIPPDPQKTLVGRAVTLDPEHKLNWWREDLGLSEHHAHWHLYYAWYKPLKIERQGELFAYMHEQMLARYDFQRLGVGLPPVLPYGPGIHWDDPIPEGFNPKLEGFSFRASYMSIPASVTLGSQQILASVMETHKERISKAITINYFEDSNGNKVPMTMTKLGCTVESDAGSANKKLYGNLHNFGHVVIALINDPDERYGIKFGAMMEQITAARDPVFFRWHKFVDSIFEEYRESDHILPHTIHDLKMEGIEVDTVSTQCEPDKELDSKDLVDRLYTKMIEKKITVYVDKKEKNPLKSMLQYYPFNYHFTVRNKREEKASLVFRVFLAPIRYAEDLDARRRDFVEMDRFVADIDGGSEQTITRSSEDSSVTLPPTVTVQDIQDGKCGDSPYSPCGCGWPRNLLVPRGTSQGMWADLYVLVTDWKKDAANEDTYLSASVVFCGKRKSEYPDKKPMGFPFDRKFSKSKFPDLEKMVKDVPNSATKQIKIIFLENSD
ncbi:hemocyanin AA6 chain-like [Bolinopsis microptera]|uniref:hemocyanin AA6 chain-like n=1 Tax=Bolinopsis microptera TaxID=2820187 RepID=UPI003079998F